MSVTWPTGELKWDLLRATMCVIDISGPIALSTGIRVCPGVFGQYLIYLQSYVYCASIICLASPEVGEITPVYFFYSVTDGRY